MSQNNKDRVAWIEGPSGECASIPSGSGQPSRLVLLGAPGVGKGTQADLLHQSLGACHLSTGDVFRAAGSRSECDQTPAMKEAMAHMRRGELVPDTTVWEMVRERSACLRCRGGFILDGFPRTLMQAEALKNHLQEEQIGLTAVVSYELPLEEIVARISGRRVCEKCKAVFHIKHQPPQVEGKCDRCDGKLYQREDDRSESVAVRMETYEKSTAPLIDFYEKSGLLLRIPAIGSPEEICERTIKALQLVPHREKQSPVEA